MRSNQHRAKEFKFRAGPSLAVTAITARPARLVSLRERQSPDWRSQRPSRFSFRKYLMVWALRFDCFHGGIPARDAALHRASRQSVQTESTCRFAATVKDRYNAVVEVLHLALPIDP